MSITSTSSPFVLSLSLFLPDLQRENRLHPGNTIRGVFITCSIITNAVACRPSADHQGMNSEYPGTAVVCKIHAGLIYMDMMACTPHLWAVAPERLPVLMAAVTLSSRSLRGFWT